MACGKLIPNTNREDGRYVVSAMTIYGPASYVQGGTTITIDELGTITDIIIKLRNEDNAKRIKYYITDVPNEVKLMIYTMSADTATGEINVTEDSTGTDESSLVFDIFAMGW